MSCRRNKGDWYGGWTRCGNLAGTKVTGMEDGLDVAIWQTVVAEMTKALGKGITN